MADASAAERELLAPNEAGSEARFSTLLHSDEGSTDEQGYSISRLRLACVVFSAYAARVYFPHAWDPESYIPVLSPVYRQQEHWLIDPHGKAAVVGHITCGLVMMIAVVSQLSARIRKERPWLHRWTGRIYVAAGVGALISLRWLRSSSGAGSAAHGDPLMRAFIDASPVAWLVVTLLGVDAAARRKDFAAHRRLMLLSAALASQPILQRLLNALLLTPIAMAVRAVHCLFVWGLMPWEARWGAPGSAYTLLFSPAAQLAFGAMGASNQGTGAGALLTATQVDGRASPLLFSPDGYGEAEQTAFGASAWLALLAILSVGVGCPELLKGVAVPQEVSACVAVETVSEAPWASPLGCAASYIRCSRKLSGRLAEVFCRPLGRWGAYAAAALIWATLLSTAAAAVAAIALMSFAFVVGFVSMLPILTSLVAVGLAAPLHRLLSVPDS